MMMSEAREIEFSVIIPVFHGGNFLRELLQSLYKLDYPLNKYEVIVAGAENDVRSRKIVENEISHNKLNITYTSCPKSRKAVKLNSACTVANGRFLFFVDDDCILLSNCLKNLEKIIQNNNNIGVIGGSDELGTSDSVFELALDCILNSFMGTGGLRRNAGVKVGKYYPKLWNMTVSKDVIASISLDKKNGRLQVFRESLTVYEDIDLIMRIEKTSKKIIYAPEVAVKHSRNTNFFSFVQRNIKSVHTAKAIGIYFYPQMILGLFVLWLTIGGILSFYLHSIRFLFLSSWAIYLLIMLFIATRGALKHRRFQVFLYVPLVLFSLHFSRGFAYFIFWPTQEREK